MKRTIILLLAALCGFVAVAFAADYLVFRLRVFRNISPYAEVTVQEYYAIQEKNNRTEYVYKDMAQQQCINALFSHRGYAPCWYARRHTEKAVHI
jgi:hypothetical protein